MLAQRAADVHLHVVPITPDRRSFYYHTIYLSNLLLFGGS